MKGSNLPDFWDSMGVKCMCWCCSCPGLHCPFWQWDLCYFSTAGGWGFRGKRGARLKQRAVFGNCHVLVCIKVVSPRGSNQEYSWGVLDTLSTPKPRGACRGRARQGHTVVPMGKNRSVAMVLGCFGSVLIFGCVELQRCLAWVDLSHLSPCWQVLSSLGVYGWQKKAWQKWQSHYTSNYMLVWASAEGVMVESVHLKDYVDSECVGSRQVGSLCFGTLRTLQSCEADGRVSNGNWPLKAHLW